MIKKLKILARQKNKKGEYTNFSLRLPQEVIDKYNLTEESLYSLSYKDNSIYVSFNKDNDTEKIKVWKQKADNRKNFYTHLPKKIIKEIDMVDGGDVILEIIDDVLVIRKDDNNTPTTVYPYQENKKSSSLYLLIPKEFREKQEITKDTELECQIKDATISFTKK